MFSDPGLLFVFMMGLGTGTILGEWLFGHH